MGSQTDLDQGGTSRQWVRTYLGPTLGWKDLPVMPELEITSAATLTIPAYASRVLLKAAVKIINLPSVSQWMLATLPLANVSPFDRSLWIKDYVGDASTGSPIVINADSPDTIDTLASFSIITQNDLIRLYPLTDLTGWYVG